MEQILILKIIEVIILKIAIITIVQRVVPGPGSVRVSRGVDITTRRIKLCVMLKLLIESGADVNARDYKGNIPNINKLLW